MVGDQLFEAKGTKGRVLPGASGQASFWQSAYKRYRLFQKPRHLLSSLLDWPRRPTSGAVRREGPRGLPGGEIPDGLDDLGPGGVDQVVQHFFNGPLVTRLEPCLNLADALEGAAAVGGGTLHEESQVGQAFGGVMADVGEGLLGRAT